MDQLSYMLGDIQHYITFQEWIIGWVCFAIFITFLGKAMMDADDRRAAEEFPFKNRNNAVTGIDWSRAGHNHASPKKKVVGRR